MDLSEDEVRARCTGAVFERAQQYREEGRILSLERFGETITAVVRGNSDYDVTVEVDSGAIDATCSCLYDGTGDCKHVVAVLLERLDESPVDAERRVRAILDDVPADDLQAFLLDAFQHDPDLYDRFVARFGSPSDDSVDEYRAEVDALFDRHTEDYPVVTEAIDFAQITEQAATYRERGYHDEAATIYRALLESIDEHYVLIDAAYDHYAQVFQSALEGYVECAEQAATGPTEREYYLAFLAERARDGPDVLRTQYRDAIADLEA